MRGVGHGIVGARSHIPWWDKTTFLPPAKWGRRGQTPRDPSARLGTEESDHGAIHDLGDSGGCKRQA